MKKKILVGLVSLLSLSLPCVAGLSSNEKENVLAATLTGPTNGPSLPTTINLNDNLETEIRNYYSSLSSLSDSERSGTNLLKNLKSILRNMYYYSYDNVWKIYEITDRNWELSPASGTTYGTYNASTNQFSNYTYGSNSDGKNDPYVRALYRDDSEAGRITAWGIHDTQAGINREHVWPQSRGFKKEGSGASGPAGTDVHHLMAGDARVNQYHHNNYPYGNVDKNTAENSVDYKSYLPGNYLGTSLYDGTSKVFEPADQHKGDIARAIFYMAARYNNWAGITGAITEFEPFLEITNEAYTDETVESSDTQSATMGILHDLLEWHEEDPVDEFEIHRNNLIYNNYQLNRNPFIDFPEWVSYIWGTSENVGVSQGNASPSTDTINGYSLSLSSSSLSLEVGENATITVSSDNPLSTFTWSIDNSTVVSLSSTSGESVTVTALAAGNATITVTDNWGDSATCSLTVKEKPSSSSTPSSSSSTSTPTPSGNLKEGFVKCESVSDVTSGTYIIAADATAHAEKGGWFMASKTLNTTNDRIDVITASSLSAGKVKTGEVLSTGAIDIEVDGTDSTHVYIKDSTGGYIEQSSVNKTNLGVSATKFYWTISDGVNGTFRLTSSLANDATRALMYSPSNGYFRCYSSSSTTSTSTGYFDLELFRLADASEFAVSFMDKTGEVCVADGSTNVDSLKTAWSTLSSEYSALSTEAKAVLKSSEVTDDYILNALQRYRFIVKKYSSSYTDINNFMDLTIQNAYHHLDGDSSSDGYLIYIVIGLIAIAATSFFIFRKSKKEN